MDIREEIRLSKEDKLPESSGLPYSGQQSVKGRRGLISPKKGKSDSPKKRQRSFSPRKGRVLMSERVFNPTPITQFNPVTNEVLNDNVKLVVMTEDAGIVKEYPIIVNQKLAAVVKDPLRYSRSVKGKPAGALVDKASVLSVTKTNVLTQLETAPDVVNDKVSKESVLSTGNVVNDKVSKESVLSTGNVDVVQVDPAKVVIQSVLTQLENAPDVENSAPDVGKNKNVVADKVDVAKDVVQDDPTKVVKECVAKDKPKDKPKGSVSFVVVRKDNRKENSKKEALFQKDKALNVVSKTSQSLRLLIWEEGKMEGWYGILIQFLLMKKRSEIKRNLIEQKNVKGWFEEKTSILVGGHSLFNLVERETGDEFVKKWAAQFSPKELKQIRVNDNAWIIENSEKQIMSESHEIQMESHEIQVESHEIPLKSQEIQSHESHEIMSDLMRFTLNLKRTKESHEIKS
ncbi:hypothetical protein Tco_0088295 [Tanacetum coccineum]